jgi:hypothetical protein
MTINRFRHGTYDLGYELNEGDTQGWARHTQNIAVWYSRPLPKGKLREGE